MGGKATLHEIETQWSVADLLDANIALDWLDACADHAQKDR